MSVLLASLVKLELLKVMDCKTEKKIWENMKSYYDGKNKVKKYKLEGLNHNLNL